MAQEHEIIAIIGNTNMGQITAKNRRVQSSMQTAVVIDNNTMFEGMTKERCDEKMTKCTLFTIH